ncbi:MAG TPA: G8 domain-containing protein [Planctomycetota bacterium]|jgi:hypothetical protein|nr:G8 domain-containing protein [Planctomycetota bacterium]
MCTRLAILSLILLAARLPADVIKSAKSGPWSDAATWEGGAVPAAGSKVLVRPGHAVLYDVVSEQAIRSIFVGGTLRFATDRDTRLDVGLIKIQAGEDCVEDGFTCDVHLKPPDPKEERPALEVGTTEQPVDAARSAKIRLVYFDGMDKETLPAIICCGGRMEFHGAAMNRTWLKLGATVKPGDADVTLSEPVSGWKTGDRILLTATKRDESESGTRRPGKRNRKVFTEERTIKSVDAAKVTLIEPAEIEHLGAGETRGEIANLSRNVVVESADPERMRGHTMYHKHSAGSISYAEFRHLGKENVLGKYSLHFHLLGSTMRGASVIGASIWDSGNRWITIHGTNYLVVRDCVGYQSVGHGFFLEDGTEAYNVLDRNLAVQSYKGKKLPKQVLPFDQNEGSGFWWANNLNAFTRNVSCENDRYGYRFEATRTSQVKLTMPVLQPDGQRREVDIRTLPFVRFDDNESHSEGLYGINLGEGVDRVGPDAKHPLILRNTKLWDVHYAFRPEIPSVLAEDLRILRAVYGIYHPDFNNHVYRRVYIGDTNAEPFNRGHDDENVQYGPFTVDGLVMERCNGTLIQVSQHSPTGKAAAHFRAVEFRDNKRYVSAYVDTTANGQPKDAPADDVIPYVFHDWFGPGRHAKLLTAQMAERANDGLEYKEGPAPFVGKKMKAAEARDIEFPELLTPVDDLPPATVITSVSKGVVRGTTADGGVVKRVLVNGREAKATAPNFAEWEIAIDTSGKLEAWAEDAAGNVETQRHIVERR